MIEQEATAPDFGPRFEVLGELGRGSMGVVHDVLDRELERRVALKTLSDVGPEALAAVKREFRLLRHVEHPNVVGYHELFFGTGGNAWFTMERIEGRPFPEVLREAFAAGDEAGVRHLVAQAVDALRAIHAVGAVHRDIKPSNLVVDGQRRVFVLDLGLAELGRRLVPGKEVAGTLAYLAPEALFGSASPASDWFSLGAVLAEAIGGRLPWEPWSFTDRVVPPERLRASLPEPCWPWLVDAIVGLLAPDPARRRAEVERGAGDAPGEPPSSIFVGRTGELARLEQALRLASGGERVLVEIEGPAGIGKTSLLEAFLAPLRERREVVVVAGDCHHTEQIPYRALDPVLEDLAEALRRRAGFGDEEAIALLRRWQMVGTLPGRLMAVEPTPEPSGPRSASRVPSEQRREALRALQQVWTALRRSATTVVVLENVQWGDADSASLLWELVEPAGPLLLVLSRRSGESVGPFEERWRTLGWSGSRESIVLGELPEPDGAALVASLRPGAGAHEVEAIVRAAKGVPFLLQGLSRADDGGVGDLRSLTERRLARLDDHAVRLLRLLSLQPEPLPTAVLLEAAGVGPGGIVALRRLESAGLVRNESAAQIALYHELLREPVRSTHDRGAEPELHDRLAGALHALAPDRIEARVVHLVGAGRVTDAADACHDGADAARQRMEFLREAAWLRRELELRERRDVDLLERCALAYYNAGHHAQAGEAYVEAFQAAASSDASSRRIERLKARAADALTAAGRVDAGEAIYRELLVDKGVPYVRSRARGIAEGMWHRLRANVAPFQPPRVESLHDPWEMELLRSTAQKLTLSRMHVAFAMSGLHFARAMRGGTALDQAEAIATEATFQAGLGGWWAKRSEALIQRLEWLFSTYELPAHRNVEQTRGPWHWHFGRWAACAADCGRAAQRIRIENPGDGLRLAIADSFGNSARSFMGDFGTLEQEVDDALQAALDRGDQFAHLLLDAGDVGIRYFVRGDLEGAEALSRRVPSYIPADAGVMEYSAATHIARTHLYAGRVREAAEHLHDAIPRLQRNQALAMRVPRAITTELHARALARLALDGDRKARRGLGRCIAVLRRIDLPFAAAMVAKARGALAHAEGDPERARACYREAAEGFERADMRLFAWAARVGAGDDVPCPVVAGDRERLLLLLDPVVVAARGRAG